MYENLIISESNSSEERSERSFQSTTWANSKFWEELSYDEVANGMLGHIQLNIIYDTFYRFFGQMISVWGIVGNYITILVLVRKGFKDTINMLLVSIAVCDIIFLTTDLVQDFHQIMASFDLVLALKLRDISRVYTERISNGALLCSLLQVTMIAVERVVAVLFPFIVGRVFTPSRIKCIIACIPGYVCAFLAPLSVYEDIHMYEDDGMIVNDLRRNMKVLSNMFLYIFPMFIILTSNVIIGVQLHLSSSSFRSGLSRNHSRTKQKDLKLFKMLFMVCCVPIISLFPRATVALYSCIGRQVSLLSEAYSYLFDNFCFHIFTSFNFVIYVTMSSKFAAEFKQIVCGQA